MLSYTFFLSRKSVHSNANGRSSDYIEVIRNLPGTTCASGYLQSKNTIHSSRSVRDFHSCSLFNRAERTC